MKTGAGKEVEAAKRALRARMREGLRSMTPDELEEGSRRIRERIREGVKGEGAWGGARCLLGYVALEGEPDLMEALRGAGREGRRVAVPRWNAALGEYEAAEVPPEGGWVAGPYGVREPPASMRTVGWEHLDLIVVPGLAFDLRGRRLGRGKGFYDRLLVRARGARRWGVAFERQIVAEVPCDAHDINVDVLVTPGRWLPVPAGATS